MLVVLKVVHMPIVVTNIFIYTGLLIFAFLFLIGINDLSFSVNFLSLDTIDTRVLVMLLLAEPHFAMTIPLLYGYRQNFAAQPLAYIYIPIVIILLASLLFFYKSDLFFLIFLIANVYHVNRQSVGFLKLQARFDLNLAKLYEINLHILTIVCLYFALIRKTHEISIAIYLLLMSLISMIILIRVIQNKWPTLRELFVIVQGYFIFLPIVIFEDILLAFAVGISIHYIQYLSISWNILRKGFGFQLIPLLAILLAYSLFSTGALSGMITKERISILVFFPTLMQLLHFYYDSFIWRRSDKLVAATMKKALS